MDEFKFMYCQKIIVFSKDEKKVLLAKRKGENDYDGVFSFIGGKMETTDKSLIEGLTREKNEEVGENFKIKVFHTFSHNLLWRRNDGNAMVLPHYLAIHESGEITLNEEYSEYVWVPLDELDNFEPMIKNIPQASQTVLRLLQIAKETDFVVV